MKPRALSLRTAVALSLALHLAAVLVPMDPQGMGEGVAAPVGFVVSLLEMPRAEAPAAKPLPPAPEPRPETPPVPAVPEAAPQTAPREDAGAVSEPASPPAGAPVPAADAGSPSAGEAPGSGPGEGETAVRFRPPRLLVGGLPIDPEDSGKLEVPDEIPVRLRIGVDGRVLEIIPENPDLSDPVRKALDRSAAAMRFAPARRGDRAVEGWFSMTFVFRR